MSAILFEDVWEKYRLRFVHQGRARWEEVNALQGISLSVPKGQILGIIGENGSGKTTFLKLAAGMLVCDKGKVKTEGRVAALMELGAGFNREFTGRENILLNAKTYGFKKDALLRCVQSVEAFADLGRFFDAPIKSYSQGMFMRLAFALAVFVEPDIFLIDDILSVGDERSQRRCIEKIFELKRSGKTMVIVSHDMHFVRQICDRAVLFENGKVVQDGKPDEIISFYLEGVGDREGVAAIETCGIKATFNNGNVSLRHKGRIVTQAPGAYVSLFIPSINHWCPSKEFHWSIKERSEERIVATGVYGDNIMSQEWILQIKENRFLWDIRANGSIAKEPHIDFILSSRYNRWKTLKQEGVFPAYSHKHEWQPVDFKNPPAGLISFYSDMQIDTESNPPFIMLAQEDIDTNIALLNTGYELEGRVAQFFFTKDMSLSFRAEFADTKRDGDRLWRDRSGYLLESYKKNEREYLKNRSFENGDLVLAFDDTKKKIRIFYQDSELTAGCGFVNNLEIDGRKYSFLDAKWVFDNVSSDESILRLDFGTSGIKQKWHFFKKNPQSFLVRAVFDSQNTFKVTRQNTVIELKDSYESWKTPFESGSLCAHRDFSNLYPIRWRNNKASSVALIGNRDGQGHPSLLFSVVSDKGRRFMGLTKKRDEGEETLCINNAMILTSAGKDFDGNGSVFFEGSVSLLKDGSPLVEETAVDDTVEISKGSLRFVFDSGRGRIFWGKKELTKDLGVYTTLRSCGVWMDSFQALWCIEEKTLDKIVVIGSWPFVPIEQRWTISFCGANIFWEVVVSVSKNVNIEAEQAGVMLVPDYSSWQAGKSTKGSFPDFYSQDYDIMPFRSWYGDIDEISATGNNIPNIVLARDARCGFLRGLIENSDSVYQAKVLLYQKPNNAEIKTGAYTLFKGVLRVEPSK